MKQIFRLKFICSLLFFYIINLNSYGVTFKNGETIFDQRKIHDIRLTFSQPHYWDTLLARYSSSHDSSFSDSDPFLGNVVIDGTELDSIGVNLKSYSSYSIPGNKKPLKFRFNAFVKGRDYEGLHRLNLSNEFPDPSMLRNTIAFHILRNAGVIAPRTSFARVYINEDYVGLYVIIEQVDKEFLSNYFKSPDGDIVKALSSSLYWDKNEGIESFRKNFEIKTKNDSEAYIRLFDFAKKINSTPGNVFYDSLSGDLDFASYIPVLAADIIFNNWDSYFYGLNYFLYHDASKNKYFFLPWDYNLSLNNYDVSGGDFAILPNGEDDKIFKLPLPSKIISNEKLKHEYIDQLKKINQQLSEDSLRTFIDRLHDLISASLKSDPGKAFTMEEFENSLNKKVKTSEMEFEGLFPFIRYRHDQVKKMLEAR